MPDEQTEHLKRIADRLTELEGQTQTPEPVHRTPKQIAQVIVAIPFALLISVAAFFEVWSVYKGAKGQPNVVVDTAPYESLIDTVQNNRSDIRENQSDIKKKELLSNNNSSEIDTIKTQVSTIISFLGQQ